MVHVVNVTDLAIVAIQKPHGQRVASTSADTNHPQHNSVIGRSGPDGSSVGENRHSGGEAERGRSGTIQELTPVDFGRGINVLSMKVVPGIPPGRCGWLQVGCR